jgi:hypothetical protein
MIRLNMAAIACRPSLSSTAIKHSAGRDSDSDSRKRVKGEIEWRKNGEE